jgi:hypothetical protein
MKKILCFFFILLSKMTFAVSAGASLSIAPISVYVNQPMGASLTVWNYSYGSGDSLYLLDVIPQTWVTVGGSSAVPVGWDKPALGPGQSTTVSPGSSVIFWYSAVFFSPSISPAYAGQSTPFGNGWSLTAAGTQTFSVGALVRASDGSTFSPASKTLTVLPLALPNAQLQ